MKQKKQWQKPQITQVNLDNEISILMTSPPPGDPFKFSAENSNDVPTSDPYA